MKNLAVRAVSCGCLCLMSVFTASAQFVGSVQGLNGGSAGLNLGGYQSAACVPAYHGSIAIMCMPVDPGSVAYSLGGGTSTVAFEFRHDPPWMTSGILGNTPRESSILGVSTVVLLLVGFVLIPRCESGNRVLSRLRYDTHYSNLNSHKTSWRAELEPD
jgi:hypothetical protein